MSIFNNIKKALSSNSTNINTPSNTDAAPKSFLTNTNSSKYYTFSKTQRFKKNPNIQLGVEDIQGIESFFSLSKENPKLIGFEKRSRKKFRNLHNDKDSIVAYASDEIEVVKATNGKRINLKDTDLEKVKPVTSNGKGVILNSKEKVAFINLTDGRAFAFTFQWQPFSFAIGNDFWLVGTRESYNGPGELYCFDFNANLKWAIDFNEQFESLFGEMVFMPYLLKVSEDSTDILVASMDRLYRLDVNGNLKARIALSELREKELQDKQKDLQNAITKPPTTEEEAISQFAKQLAMQFSVSMERMSFTSPFAGFSHDVETDMLFVLEEKGRVSAWDKSGKLMWINSFKNEGRYISWIDNKVVVSFQTGETFWLNREGRFIYGAKLPKQATTIQLIPNQSKYLVVCQDNRLYELHKNSGEMIKGSEGHPGMELFNFIGQNVFFDGGINSQGYFWIAPQNQEWVHFEAKNFTETTNSSNGVAPEITATKKFTKKWELQSAKEWFGNRIIDFKNKRIYVVEEGRKRSSDEYFRISETEREKDRLSHELAAYNFDGTLIWKKQILSSMHSLFLSPDGETVFTSVPEAVEITYLPGFLLLISKDGELLDKVKVDNHGFYLEFSSENRATIHFRTESGETPLKGLVNKDYFGKWSLKYLENNDTDKKSDFGLGINKLKVGKYKIIRIDKKQYEIASSIGKQELKLSAAIYEAYEILGEYLILRVGSRLIAFYNENLEKVGEVKEEENIQSVCPGANTFVVLTKDEIKGYDYTGEVAWKYSALPKSSKTEVFWIESQGKYLWVVSNNLECIVASINESGEVLKSHSFDEKNYHRPVLVSVEDELFVAQTNSEIRVYKI